MTKGHPIFDAFLYDLVGKKKPKQKDIGIEIETEVGPKDANPAMVFTDNYDKYGKTKFWSVKGDGSLRNGAEFFTNGPVYVNKLDDALLEFEKYSQGCKFRKDSIRTSVHYHLNVTPLTLNQIIAAIVGWWLVETPIVNTQGPTRVGNLFCLRVSDAEHLVQDLIRSIREDNTPLLGGSLGDNVKYAALNINAVGRFGSLEFRFNRGTVDPSEITKWGRFLYSFVHKCASYNTPMAIVEHFEKLQAADFAYHMLPTWLLRSFSGNWTQGIDSNYSYAYMIAQITKEMQADDDNVRVIRIPSIKLDPDMQDFPYEDTEMFSTKEFSPDEDLLPNTRFVSDGRASRKKSNSWLNVPPGLSINWGQVANEIASAPPPPPDNWIITNATANVGGVEADVVSTDEWFAEEHDDFDDFPIDDDFNDVIIEEEEVS